MCFELPRHLRMVPGDTQAISGPVNVWCNALTTSLIDGTIVSSQCAAAKRHPKVAFGYIFYKLRPVEFAAGFCIAKGPCGHKRGGCSQYHDELVFDLMQDDNMSLDDGAEDAAIFY